MRQDILTRSVKIIALIVLLTYFLFHAKPFLVPVVFGALFSMLLTPVATKLEEWKIPRALSVILSILLIIQCIKKSKIKSNTLLENSINSVEMKGYYKSI